MLSFLGIAINSDNCIDAVAFLKRLSIGDPSRGDVVEGGNNCCCTVGCDCLSLPPLPQR